MFKTSPRSPLRRQDRLLDFVESRADPQVGASPWEGTLQFLVDVAEIYVDFIKMEVDMGPQFSMENPAGNGWLGVPPF